MIAACCADGVVIASDRSPFSSARQKSSLVTVDSSRNMFKISNKVTIGVLDGTGEFQALLRALRSKMRQHSFYAGDSSEFDVDTVALLARKLVYSKFPRERIIVAGWSQEAGGYRLYELSPQGALFRQSFVAGGTGGDTAHSMLELLFRQGRDQLQASETEVSSVLSSTFDPFQKLSSFDRRTSPVTRWKGSSSKTQPLLKDVIPAVKSALAASAGVDGRSGARKMDVWIINCP